MNPRFFRDLFFLMVSLSAPLVAGPFDRERNAGQSEQLKKASAEQQEEQGRRLSEAVDWDHLRQDPQQAAARSSGAVTATDESLAPTQQSIPLTEREQVFAQLSRAFRQAEARRDEDHPDWDRVDEWIEKLYPSDVNGHKKRRCSRDQREALAAEGEQLEYYFFTATLPAIRKASGAPTALPSSLHFQAPSIIEKAEKEKQAWQEARQKFQKYCKEGYLLPSEEEANDSMPDENLNSYNDYVQKLDYHIARCDIESRLNALHHDIVESIFQADVTTPDFHARTFSADVIISHYRPLLALIAEEKKFAGSADKDKWEQLEQEATTLALYDSTQVERIKLWKNRNQVDVMHKAALRAEEQLAKNLSSHDTPFQENLASQMQAALDAWQARQTDLQTFQAALNKYKTQLRLPISTAIEREIAAELQDTETAIEHFQPSKNSK